MIISIISTIFSGLGIYGFFNDILWLLYLGMAAVIIENIVGVYSGTQNNLTTIWFALIIAFGMFIGGNNLLQSIALCICFEGVITFILGILLIIFGKRIKNSTETITRYPYNYDKNGNIQNNYKK